MVSYFKKSSKNVEVIDIIQQYPFNIANAMKYLFRVYRKTTDFENVFSDLKKAKYYIDKAIKNGDGYIYSDNNQKLMIAKNNAYHYINEFSQDTTHIPKSINGEFGVLQTTVLELLSGILVLENSPYGSNDYKEPYLKNITTLEVANNIVERLIEIITYEDGEY